MKKRPKNQPPYADVKDVNNIYRNTNIYLAHVKERLEYLENKEYLTSLEKEEQEKLQLIYNECSNLLVTLTKEHLYNPEEEIIIVG